MLPTLKAGSIDMIRMIDRSNRHEFIRTLEQHFRLRHEIFVKERGWKEFDRDGIYEMDQYDNDDATYLISVDEHDEVVGSSRIYPTALPHMLSEQFPALVEGAVPQRIDLVEFTRLAICRSQRGTQIYHEQFLGLQEFCLDQGMSGATTLIRTHRIPIVQKAGMKVVPLGLSQEIDGEMCTAIFIEASEEILMRMRDVAGITGTVMEDRMQPARKIA
jgi:acyl-homoserine lactone synthase